MRVKTYGFHKLTPPDDVHATYIYFIPLARRVEWYTPTAICRLSVGAMPSGSILYQTVSRVRDLICSIFAVVLVVASVICQLRMFWVYKMDTETLIQCLTNQNYHIVK